jgi:hypothetical protein
MLILVQFTSSCPFLHIVWLVTTVWADDDTTVVMLYTAFWQHFLVSTLYYKGHPYERHGPSAGHFIH